MDLKLTPVERLILSHQCRILAALYPKERKDFERWSEAIESGYALHYDDRAQHINPEFPADDCREVLRILSMFEHLGCAYDVLEDKSGIEEGRLRFQGFDGNDNGDGPRLGYVRYLLDEEGRFGYVKKTIGRSFDDFNSHMPMLDTYRYMLHEWERSADKYRLTRDDLLRITARA